MWYADAVLYFFMLLAWSTWLTKSDVFKYVKTRILMYFVHF